MRNFWTEYYGYLTHQKASMLLDRVSTDLPNVQLRRWSNHVYLKIGMIGILREPGVHPVVLSSGIKLRWMLTIEIRQHDLPHRYFR